MFSVKGEELLVKKGYYINIVLLVVLREHTPGYSLMLAPSSQVDCLYRFLVKKA